MALKRIWSAILVCFLVLCSTFSFVWTNPVLADVTDAAENTEIIEDEQADDAVDSAVSGNNQNIPEEQEPGEDPITKLDDDEAPEAEDEAEDDEQPVEEDKTAENEFFDAENTVDTSKSPVKAPVLRAGTPLVLTYENNKYVYDGAEHDSFPASGSYILGSDIPVSAQIAIDTELSIDLNGFDIIDNYNNTKVFISVQQGDTFNLTDSSTDPDNVGKIRSSQAARHTAVYINNGGAFNFSGGSIEDFLTNDNGGAINIQHVNDVCRMTGTASVKNCGTTASTGGGGINVYRGKLYMTDNASVTGCYTTFVGTNREKQGNGAGIQVGNSGTLYLSGNASITGNHGTGYHGAGIDLWSSGIMHLSGAPTITNNLNGRNEPVNLYAGSVVTIDGEMTGPADSIGISVQSNPVFTSGLKENNPDSTIEDLIAIFDADRYYWESLPRHLEYSVIDHDGVEAKQAPTIDVFFMRNQSDPDTVFKTQQIVPGGYATNPGNPSRTGFNFKGWFRTSAGTGSAWSFSSNTVPINDNLYLYAKWEPKPYTITVVTEDPDLITGIETTTVTYGNDFTAEIVPVENYKLISVLVDGHEQLPESDEPVLSYTVLLENVTKAHTITVVAERYQATVTFTVAENDHSEHLTITSLENPVIVQLGEDVTFTFDIDTEYYIESLSVNGEKLPAQDIAELMLTNEYTVENVTEDILIEATVGKMITVSIAYTGDIDDIPDPEFSTLVLPGEGFSFTATAPEGYHIAGITINGEEIELTDIHSMPISLTDLLLDQDIEITIEEDQEVVVFIPEPTGFSKDDSVFLYLFGTIGGLFAVYNGARLCKRYFC